MSAHERGETGAATGKAVFQTTIRGTMEQVWREITKTDEPQQAIFGAQMRRSGTEPGSHFAMETPDGKYTSVIGEVLEWDPPRRFAHTHRFTHLDDPWCKVIYDLEETPEGVRFTLTVDEMPMGTKTAKSMQQGGPMIVNQLKSIVETGRPTRGYRVLMGVFKVLMPVVMSKKTRSESWKHW